jgi:hypothetical protein
VLPRAFSGVNAEFRDQEEFSGANGRLAQIIDLIPQVTIFLF